MVTYDECRYYKPRSIQTFSAAVCAEGVVVRPTGATADADLGSSSKYTSKILVDRCGEGFRANSIWTWVSRP